MNQKNIDEMTDEEHDAAWEEALSNPENVEALNKILEEVDKEIEKENYEKD